LRWQRGAANRIFAGAQRSFLLLFLISIVWVPAAAAIGAAVEAAAAVLCWMRYKCSGVSALGAVFILVLSLKAL
jgi:hypothetical protein